MIPKIKADTFVTDIVVQDFRTSYVFGKYGIDYCCGGKRPLNTACQILGLDVEVVKKELIESMRVVHISSSTDFSNWNLHFLIDYISNVHHSYLVTNFPAITKTVEHFVSSHKTKYPYLTDLLDTFYCLKNNLTAHIDLENNIIFPYIKQILHAYENRETYEALLVRTLRKPIDNMIKHEDEHVEKYIHSLRVLSSNYTAPANSCITHRVAFAKLKELDQDLMQHIHLEKNILFPKVIAIEKELLDLR